MTKDKIDKILKVLDKLYPKAHIALKHKNAFQLLVATILSAQCTDKRVNKVTPDLFKKYPKPESFAKAKLSDIEKLIYTTGFYRNKAKSIKCSSQAIMDNFHGKVPSTMRALLTLRGVARKTANVVLSGYFGKAQGIVVDTHVIRLSFRLGFTKEKNPIKIEKDLMQKLNKNRWIEISYALILHGRQICKSQKPMCTKCGLSKLCPKNGVKKSA
ncbi:MAG TPA: endonuclease III [Elusimicrobiales bacterium]|nr:endonuclease III [Elusimicrobiales bacterium]